MMIKCGDVVWLADYTPNRVNALWCGYVRDQHVARRPTLGIVLSTSAVNPQHGNVMYVLSAQALIEAFTKHINLDSFV